MDGSGGEGWSSLDSGGECYKMVLRDEDAWMERRWRERGRVWY